MKILPKFSPTSSKRPTSKQTTFVERIPPPGPRGGIWKVFRFVIARRPAHFADWVPTSSGNVIDGLCLHHHQQPWGLWVKIVPRISILAREAFHFLGRWSLPKARLNALSTDTGWNFNQPADEGAWDFSKHDCIILSRFHHDMKLCWWEAEKIFL